MVKTGYDPAARHRRWVNAQTRAGQPVVEAQPLIWDAQPWAADALCVQTDPELFFPDRGTKASEARRICAQCPVRADCLRYVLAAPPTVQGIWAGTSPAQRRKLQAAS